MKRLSMFWEDTIPIWIGAIIMSYIAWVVWNQEKISQW